MRDYTAVAERIACKSRERKLALIHVYRDSKAESKSLHERAASGRIEVKSREDTTALIKSGIPGLIPTPNVLARYMVTISDIQPGMTVLEPSAGAGHIADEIPKHASVVCVEFNISLAGILREKGYKVFNEDFLAWKNEIRFDRILMNPPFERLADINHVMKAYDHLSEVGKLIAIMGAGAFFRSDKKAMAFRRWLEDKGTADKPPNRIFNLSERPTGIKTYLVSIEPT